MISLRQRIGFQEQYGDALDASLSEVMLMPDGYEKDISISERSLDVHYKAYAYLKNISLNEARVIAISTVVTESTLLIDPLVPESLDLPGWNIQPIELYPTSESIFNEFLVSKETVRQLTAMDKGKWYALPYLCAVYLRKEGECFTEKLAQENSERFEELLDLPLTVALFVGEWFDKHNEFLYENFTVFHPSKTKGVNMGELFDRWGWVSFLSMIAKEGVFTIPGNGLNAIENAKQAKLYDVLVYASEKKDSEEIINAYYEQLNKK